MEVFPGISSDPDIRFGKPCITGTRIDVATIVGAVAAGESMTAVAEAYGLLPTQVANALAYAAHIAAHPPAEVAHLSSETVEPLAPLSLLDLRGLGEEQWLGNDAVAHVKEERDAWD